MYKYDATVSIYAPNKTPKDGNNYISYSYNSVSTELFFEIKKTNEEKPAQCSCSINGVDVRTYNEISKSTLANGVQTKYIEIFFNSKFGSETLFTGLINEVSYSFNDGKQTMVIHFDEGVVKFNNAKRSISANKGASLAAILGDIGDKFGYSISAEKGVDLNGISTPKVAVTGRLRECLSAVIPKGLNFMIVGFSVLIVRAGSSDNVNEITIDLSRGLKSYPIKMKKIKKNIEHTYYSISTVYTPGIVAGTVIKIPYSEETGYFTPQALEDSKYYRYRVSTYSKSFDGKNFVCNMECDKV